MEGFRVQTIDSEKRAVGRLLRFALIGSVVLAVILLLLLAVASANTELFESQYPMLLWLTVGLAVGLLLLCSSCCAGSSFATGAGCSARG